MNQDRDQAPRIDVEGERDECVEPARKGPAPIEHKGLFRRIREHLVEARYDYLDQQEWDDEENLRLGRQWVRAPVLKLVRGHLREAWAEYLDEEWGFALIPAAKRHPAEPLVWFANGWAGYGADGGASGRIFGREFVASWRIPQSLQWLPFVRRDDWEPEWPAVTA